MVSDFFPDKKTALAALVAVWAVFGLLVGGTLGRVREFPGWEGFLAAPTAEPATLFGTLDIRPLMPTVQSRATLPPLLAPLPTSQPSPVMSTQPPTQVQATVVVPFVVASVATAAPAFATSYPTICAQSLPTRFQPSQTGHTSWQVALRSDLNSVSGTKLASGTWFQMIGPPQCAVARGNTAEQLWWPVLLLNGGSAGVQGWLAESGVSLHGGLVYNLSPD